MIYIFFMFDFFNMFEINLHSLHISLTHPILILFLFLGITLFYKYKTETIKNLSILNITFHISPVIYAPHFEDHCYTASLWTTLLVQIFWTISRNVTYGNNSRGFLVLVTILGFKENTKTSGTSCLKALAYHGETNM